MKSLRQTPTVLKETSRPGHLPALLSDGYDGYASAMLEAFGRSYPAAKTYAKGRPSRPVLRWPLGLAYGQVLTSHQAKPADGITLKVVRGTARLPHVRSLLGYPQINTSVVERQNGTSRLHNQRKVRRTLAFSKAPRYHRWMRWLSGVQYNFCRPHGSLRLQQDHRVQHRTPAMAASLTDRIWQAQDWLLSPVLGGQR